MKRSYGECLFGIGLGVALALPLSPRFSDASKPSELQAARDEIERLETSLRLRAGELAVVRGQLRACEKRGSE